MGMAAILFDGSEPFEQIINTLSTESPMWNLVKIAKVVSVKLTLKSKCGGFPIGKILARGHPVATECFTSNLPMVQEDKSKTGFKMAAVVAISDFWSAKFIILLIYKSFCCYNVRVNSNHPTVQDQTSKIDFQGGGHFHSVPL